MSVLIKGMKMPTSCLKGGCPLDGFACQLWEDKYWASYEDPEKGRHRDCPLIETPDHGDLIDRNMLIGGFADWYIQESPMYLGDDKVVAETIGDAMKAIEAAPVVIPAERSEHE